MSDAKNVSSTGSWWQRQREAGARRKQEHRDRMGVIREEGRQKRAEIKRQFRDGVQAIVTDYRADAALRSAARQFLSSGKKPHGMFGPGDEQVLETIIDMIDQDILLWTSGGRQSGVERRRRYRLRTRRNEFSAELSRVRRLRR